MSRQFRNIACMPSLFDDMQALADVLLVSFLTLDYHSLHMLAPCGFAGGACARKWIEHKAARRRHKADQILD